MDQKIKNWLNAVEKTSESKDPVLPTGQYKGKPGTKLMLYDLDKIMNMKNMGMTCRDIGQEVGISKEKIRLILKEHGY